MTLFHFCFHYHFRFHFHFRRLQLPVVQRAKAETLEYWAANKGPCINCQPYSIYCYLSTQLGQRPLPVLLPSWTTVLKSTILNSDSEEALEIRLHCTTSQTNLLTPAPSTLPHHPTLSSPLYLPPSPPHSTSLPLLPTLPPSLSSPLYLPPSPPHSTSLPLLPTLPPSLSSPLYTSLPLLHTLPPSLSSPLYLPPSPPHSTSLPLLPTLPPSLSSPLYLPPSPPHSTSLPLLPTLPPSLSSPLYLPPPPPHPPSPTGNIPYLTLQPLVVTNSHVV